MAGDASARTSIENVRARGPKSGRSPSPQIATLLISATVADGGRMHRTEIPEILARDQNF
jgi:hypothetical protein